MCIAKHMMRSLFSVAGAVPNFGTDEMHLPLPSDRLSGLSLSRP